MGNPLDPAGPPRAGGIALLPNGIRDTDEVSPLDCLGAVMPLMRVVYEDGGVSGVALRDFARYGEGLVVSSAHTGVVRFDSDAAADRMFEVFARQWRACADTPVEVRLTAGTSLEWTVTDVREADGILSATVLTGEPDETERFPTEHAVGVVAGCIIDVDVAVTAAQESRRVPAGRAADLVRVIRENINRAR